MRFLLLLLLTLFLAPAIYGQNKKPKITGQKELTTTQGQPITIHLTDLFVEEEEDDDDHEDNDNDDDDDRDNDGGGEDDRDDDEDDDGGGNKGHGSGNEDDGGGADGSDDGDKGKGKNKGEDKKDEGDKKDKGGKGDKDNDREDGRQQAYPAGYTLEIFPGNHYQVSGNVITPDPPFTGELKVQVRVRNDQHASDKYNLRITVLPRKNVAPVITGQTAVTTAENTPLRIQLSFLVVTDPDNNYPIGFSMKIYPGENYTISGSSIVPVSGFKGSLTVSVAVNDGTDTSEPFSLKVSVTAANVAPTITGQVALSTPVNQPVTILLSHLSVSDPDNDYPSGFTLRIHPGEHYTVTNAVITPTPEFSGTLTAGVTVHDGKNESAVFDLKVQVTPAAVANVAPSISGQVPLSISANQSLTIKLSHLLVTDPDNDFPSDFTLKVLPGENYTVNGTAITPLVDFTGELLVNVFVNDGKADSKVFELNITIIEDANIPPVITGQKGIKVIEGQEIEIKLAHLVVEDPDDRYPDDFTMEVSPGDNYSLDNTRVTPVSGFVGVLQVPVKVNDGTASSEPFEVKIEVVPQGKLEILGQKTLRIDEDSSLTIALSDLMVNDPSDTYPSGFTLEVSTGDHYQAKNGLIKPEPDFFGNLTIPVTIRKGTSASATFSLLVVVNPVNDAPVLVSLQEDPLLAVGDPPWVFAPNADVSDKDDEQLLYAEIGFNSPEYESDNDEITFTNTENIHGVFDSGTGILFLIGNAALTEYQRAIRSVGYQMKNARDSVRFREKKMYLRLSDGKDISEVYERTILLDRDITLDIPSAFTPNNDMANDTWKITTHKQVDGLKTFIRVYNQKGQLVFETSDIQNEWDGVFNGAPLPADVYFYTIEMDLSYTKLSYKGIVSILR